ncbi:MAG: hypothetical protein IJH83_02050 [Coriobacteriales bacterium]|nr:hypothetical protein [Coriobacteriales bacterium]
MRYRNYLPLLIAIMMLFALCSCAARENSRGDEATPEKSTADVATSELNSIMGSEISSSDNILMDLATHVRTARELSSIMGIEVSPADKSLMDLATHVYDDQQVQEMLVFKGSIEEWNALYPIECMRLLGPTAPYPYYRVSFLGDGKAVNIEFDKSGNRRTAGFLYISEFTKADFFDELSVGQTLEEVKAFDPNGGFGFLVAGRKDLPWKSSHLTSDGYLITIEYDDSVEYFTHFNDSPIISIEAELS